MNRSGEEHGEMVETVLFSEDELLYLCLDCLDLLHGQLGK